MKEAPTVAFHGRVGLQVLDEQVARLHVGPVAADLYAAQGDHLIALLLDWRETRIREGR